MSDLFHKEHPSHEAQTFKTRIVDSLDELSSEDRFGTIYADPPWQYDNKATRGAAQNHYSTMRLDDIIGLPVKKLSARNSQLHLWTTNAFLHACLNEVIPAWGFKFRGMFVWCKEEMGLGNYWRCSHEYLLLGIRGSATFNDKTLRSWEESPRGRHSAKPRWVRDMVHRAGKGPYLEMFGREAVSGWTVFGNQIEKTLFSK